VQYMCYNVNNYLALIVQAIYSLFMAKVTHENMTAEHVKAARIFLSWSATELAATSNVSLRTIRTFETGAHIRDTSRQAIYDALVKAGITFQNGGQPGVRLVKK